jgi:hypothetical protein
MQLSSYGPSQPSEGNSRIPRARERGGSKAKERGDTQATDAAAEPNCESDTHARERENQRTYEKGFGNIPHAREREISQRRERAADNADTLRAKETWGGARNRRDRVTTALSQSHAEGLLMAMAVADLRGMPLTRHWIVDYQLAGIEDGDGAAFVGRLLIFQRRYARARGGSFAAVWVREVGRRNGAHVHIAFHWPRGWKLGHLTRRWIKAAGGTYRKRVSRIRPIGGSLNCAWTNPPLYRENLEALGNYFVKGSDSTVAAELGLELLKPGGAIVGKRSGRTQNLGQATAISV